LKKDGGVFKEKNRRAGRELLGIMTKDPKQRPLVYRKAIFGLTGTPLLDSTSRVIELASLIGATYVLGLSSHWRKMERDSSRDIFLQFYLEPKQSRETRRNLYKQCQDYIDTACCRNKVGDEMIGITLRQVTNVRIAFREKHIGRETQKSKLTATILLYSILIRIADGQHDRRREQRLFKEPEWHPARQEEFCNYTK
jgi:hypothetical protein